MSKLQLRVGGVYKNRQGEEVKIISHIGGLTYPFEDTLGRSYGEDGAFHQHIMPHRNDLVEEVAVPPSVDWTKPVEYVVRGGYCATEFLGLFDGGTKAAVVVDINGSRQLKAADAVSGEIEGWIGVVRNKRTKREGWINLRKGYKFPSSDEGNPAILPAHSVGVVYTTEYEAKSALSNTEDYLATVKIEWEE